MMDEATERKLEQALGQVIEADAPRPIRTVDEQLSQIDRIEQGIRNRIRQDRLNILSSYERTVAEMRAACEAKISDATYRLQLERDQSLRNLHEETQRKLHELNRQAERVER